LAVREQRLVFGEVADLYDRARPSYPDALIEEVLSYCASASASPERALEVGAGTGKATVALASRGLEIVALEPDPAMAAVARRNCSPFPLVRVEVASFEDWGDQTERFSLVISAQAWHWVNPEVRCPKAAEFLGPGGGLALLWHRLRWEGEPVQDDLAALYRRLEPQLYDQAGFPGLGCARTGQPRSLEEIEASHLFTDITLASHRWHTTLGPEGFTDLLLTQSDHRLLPEDRRAGLLDAVRSVVASQAGGEINVPYETYAVLGRRR
jgi:SAM-dependent methyltransferase